MPDNHPGQIDNGDKLSDAMKSKDYLLETIKAVALVAIAVEIFCLLYVIWPMIPIYD